MGKYIDIARKKRILEFGIMDKGCNMIKNAANDPSVKEKSA